jgi:hypothetical protein
MTRIEAAADAMMRYTFAPHELPLSEELQAKYRECARLALEAADARPEIGLDWELSQRAKDEIAEIDRHIVR